jgi:transcriptional regulator with XRE-family HTH domain
MAFASLKKPETETLKILMIERCLTPTALAEKCGMTRSTISNQIAKNVPSRRLRLLLESVFDQTIWSTQADFEARKQLCQQCGFDPFTAHKTQLQRIVATLKLRGRSARLKAKLIALLQCHFSSSKALSTAPKQNLSAI